MKTRFAILMGLLALLPWWLLADESAKPPESQDDAQDVVFLGDTRPMLIRLHIRIDGKPLMAAWEEFVREVFRYCDTDGDGLLSKEELQHMIPPQSLLSGGIRFGGFRGGGASALPPDRDGKVSFDAFKAYYARSGAAPFEAQLASGGSDGLTKALFEHLDTNKDGKLSRAELAAAETVLMKLDADDDEILTAQELGPNPYTANNPFQTVRSFGLDGRPLDDNSVFIVPAPGDRTERLVAALQKRYGAGEHQSITRAASGLDQATFERLDKNKDGRLDANELADFCRRAADIEIQVSISGENREEATFEVQSFRREFGEVNQPAKNTLALALGNVRMELRGPEGPMVRAPQPAPKLKELFLQQFKAADTDNNGYIDMQEAQASPFFQQSFKLIDRDGDGRIYEKELIVYLESIEHLQQKAVACRASVTIKEGQGLFELLDTNHDGRLTIREIRAAPRLLDQLDKDGNGYLSLEKIPRNFQLAFYRGQVNPAVRTVAFKVGGAMSPAPPARTAGPLWFRKMDKNHDGDVSRREFLGTKEEFDRIDADADGLISLEEAERYDALKRKATADKK